MADDFESEFEPDDPAKGVTLARVEAIRLTGKSPTAFDNWVRNGLPVRKTGGRVEVNSAVLFDWHAARQRGDDEETSKAKLEQIRVNTRLKRIALAERSGLLFPVDMCVNVLGAVCGGVKNGALAVPTQVHGLAPEQHDALEHALHDLLVTVHASVVEKIRELGGDVDDTTGEVAFGGADVEQINMEIEDDGFEEVDGTQNVEVGASEA